MDLDLDLTTTTKSRTNAAAVGEAFGALYEHLARSSARPVGPPLALYHGAEFDPDDLYVELCLPVDRPLSGAAGLDGRALPAATVASTLHAGRYEASRARTLPCRRSPRSRATRSPALRARSTSSGPGRCTDPADFRTECSCRSADVGEGLWWGGGPGDAAEQRKAWRWKLLMRVPDFVAVADVRRAAAALAARGRDGAGVALETFARGRAVQVLHLGPYANEPATLARLEAFATEAGLAFTGPHHEIYLSDPTRTAPARLRTILRHAVRKASRASDRSTPPR